MRRMKEEISGLKKRNNDYEVENKEVEEIF